MLIARAGPTHRGAVTHHQDQVIVLVSLSTKNVMNKIVVNESPLR